MFAAAMIGGTASESSGGKFANGAMTGAFSQAFNAEHAHNKAEAFVQAKFGDILEVGYSTNTRFSADFIPSENYSVSLVDGVVTVSQGPANYQITPHSLGGGMQFFGKRLISFDFKVNVLSTGEYTLTGQVTYNQFFTFGATTSRMDIHTTMRNNFAVVKTIEDRNALPDKIVNCAVDGNGC